MIPILVLNGPNMNLLGEREPHFYGGITFVEINKRLAEKGTQLGLELRFFQSNSEGALIDALHDARLWANGAIFNPGGYTHTSVALHDAIAAIRIPVIEVHLSNPHAREEYRHHSFMSPVCVGTIVGFGWHSYALALQAMVDILQEEV